MALVDASLELFVIVGIVLALYKSNIMADAHGQALDRVAKFLPTATVAAFQLILSSYPQTGDCTSGEVGCKTSGVFTVACYSM